jgi:peptidoglycan/LPS O-acetylase OafA/YrhL
VAATRRLHHIDGLRALAALGVLANHAWLFHPGGLTAGTILDRLFKMGSHGVDLFFVVSGFCLAYPYLARIRAEGTATFDPAAFITRRLVRILPPYYAAIVCFAVAYRLLGLRSPGLAPLALVEQFAFLDVHQSYLANVFWTLAVELRWYFAFPFLLWAFVRAPRAFALAGAGAYLLFYTTRLNAIDVGTLPAFMLGIWAADLELSGSRLRRYAPAVAIPCALAAFAATPASSQGYYAVEPVGVIAAFATLVACGAIPFLRQLLSVLPLRELGVASYSLYLVHEPVLTYAEEILHLPVAVAVILALMLSLLFFAAFERPFLNGRLRRAVIARLYPRIARLADWFGLPAAIAWRAP